MRTITKSIFFYVILLKYVCYAHYNNFKLEMVNILVRHGDRTPDRQEIYQTDPYDPTLYEPFGYGELTKTGEHRMFKFGQVLRRRYGPFLEIHHHNKVQAYSTNYNRTRMSVRKILQGIYPYKITDANSWVQIPVYSNSSATDFFTNFMIGYCPKFWPLVYDAVKTPEIAKKLAGYEHFFDYLYENTGFFKINRVLSAMFLFSNVRAVVGLNQPLPKWCTPEVYDKLLEIMVLLYDILTYSNTFKRISVGYMIREFLYNIHKSETRAGGGKKVYIYGAHDMNLGIFIKSQDLLFAPAYPEFGTAIIIEKLRGWDNQVYIRILFWNPFTETFTPLKLKKCDYICPLHTYEKIVEPFMPVGNDCSL